MTLAFGLALIVALMILGIPIFVCFAIGAGFLVIFFVGSPVATIPHIFASSIDTFILIAIPFYILAGNLMLHGASSKYLVDFIGSLVAHIPGGLAVASVLGCMFFSAISGAGTPTAVAIGGIMIPYMKKAGYPDELSTGVIAVSGTLGNLIPPSIGMIIYCSIAEVSVAKQFLAGFLPGILAGSLLMITAVIMAMRMKVKREPPSNWKTRRVTFIKALPALFMPVLVLGGIYGGIFTPTEAALVASGYSLIIGLFVYHGFTRQTLWKAFTSSARTTAMIQIIIGSAILLSITFNFIGWPQALAALVTGGKLSAIQFLFVASIVYILLGFVMEAIPIQYITLPLFLPALKLLDVDLVYFGIILIINLLIGQVTPPVAVVLYATSAVSKVPPMTVFKGAIPFLCALIVTLALVILFPQISLALPNLLYGR